MMMANSEIAFGHRKFAVGTIAKLDSTCSTSCMGTPKFFAVLGPWMDFEVSRLQYKKMSVAMRILRLRQLK